MNTDLEILNEIADTAVLTQPKLEGKDHCTRSIIGEVALLCSMILPNRKVPALNCIFFGKREMYVPHGVDSSSIGVAREMGFHSISVNAGVLLRTLKALRNCDTVNIARRRDNIIIRGGFTSFTLQGNTKYFDELAMSTQPITGVEGILPTRQIAKALRYVGNDELRPVMTSVYIADEVVATDAHILYRAENESTDFAECPFMMPASVARFLCNWPEVNVTVNNDPGRGMATMGAFKVYWNNIDGRYVNYKAVWPGEQIPRSLTIALRQIVAIANSHDTYVLTATANGGRFTIRRQNELEFAELTDAACSVSIQGEITFGAKELVYAIGISPRKLLAVLRSCEQETVVMEFREPTQAIIIDGTLLLMPMNLNR